MTAFQLYLHLYSIVCSMCILSAAQICSSPCIILGFASSNGLGGLLLAGVSSMFRLDLVADRVSCTVYYYCLDEVL